MSEAPPPVWDVSTGRSGSRYLLRFDQAAEVWGTVAVHARLTVETNPVTKERAPAPIGNVQVRATQPGGGLRVVSSTVAPDRMSVEVVVGVAPATDPAPGAHAFLIRLWPVASPFDAGAAAVTAAAGFGPAVAAGTRVPASEVRFDVTVEEPARFVVVPDGDLLLPSDTREPVRFAAKVEVRSKGAWTPRLDHNISAAPFPSSAAQPWTLQMVPRSDRVWGGVAGVLQARRLVVGDGTPLDAGVLRVHTTLAQGLRIPGDRRLGVRVTTHPVTCRLAVVRTATGRVLAEKKAHVVTGDVLSVALASPDAHLRWEGLELRVDVADPPVGYGRSHLASLAVPVDAAGTHTVDLRRPEFRDRWGRTCEVSLRLEDVAPAVWRLTLAKRGWADSGVVELSGKIAFDRLQELNEKGGTLRVYSEGRLETALPQTIGPRFLKAFAGALHVRVDEDPIEGRLVPAAGARDADCLVFDIRPAGAAPGGAAPAGGAAVDVQVDLRIDPELEKALQRTDALAAAVHETLRAPARAYLEHCLEYLTDTTPEDLAADETFEARVRRVPFFLEGTTRLTERSIRAIDVRSAVMRRMTANMIDFLLEVVMLGFDIASDYWRAGRAAGREAAEEAAQAALRRRLSSLESELQEQVARLGREADELAAAIARSGEESRRILAEIGQRSRAIREASDELARLSTQITALERQALDAARGLKASEASLHELTASLADKKARRQAGRARVKDLSNEALRLKESVIPARKGDLWQVCAERQRLLEARGAYESSLRGLQDLRTAAEAQFDRQLEEVFSPLSTRAGRTLEIREQITQQAREAYRQTLRVDDLEAAGLEFRNLAARFPDDPEIVTALTRLDQALAADVTFEVGKTLVQELALEPAGKALIEQFVTVSREERQAYERQLRASEPTERNEVTPDIAALFHATGMASPLFAPPTEIASGTRAVPHGPDDWKLLSYLWHTVGYYGGAFVQYTTEGFAKIVEFADYLGLDSYASNLDGPTWSAGLAYLEHQFAQGRGQLTFSRDTAARVSARLDRVQPANLSPGASPRDTLRTAWADEDEDDARRHKEAVTAFAVALAQDALDPERFKDDLIPGLDVKAPYETLVQVAKRVGGWLKEYEHATAVDTADPTFLAQLRAVNSRRSAKKWTWTDVDHHIDWWAWFVAWAMRLGGVAGLVLVPGAGPLVTAAAFAAADVVDICAAGLRLIISGVGGLRDANAFVQDFVIINGYFHALWVGPRDSGIAGQVMGTAPIGPRE